MALSRWLRAAASSRSAAEMMSQALASPLSVRRLWEIQCPRGLRIVPTFHAGETDLRPAKS
jgi:hypothetical protein